MPERTSTSGGGGEGAYLFVACLRHLTIDHASFSRRSTVYVVVAGGSPVKYASNEFICARPKVSLFVLRSK